MLPKLKEEREWLKIGPSASLQQSLKDLETSYKRFFKGIANYPTFKKRVNGGSFRLPQHFGINVRRSSITIPKLKTPIKAVFHRSLKNFLVKSITISRTPSGKYYASLQGELKAKEPTPSKVITGVVAGHDLGLKQLSVYSDGTSSALSGWVKPLGRLVPPSPLLSFVLP